MNIKRVVVFLVILFHIDSYSNELILIQEDDKGIIDFSSIIIEADVIDIIQEKTEGNYCFSDIYKLKITDVVKGKVQNGDIIVVGLIDSHVQIFEGQTQFGFFRKLEQGYLKDFSSDCKLGALNKKINKSEVNFTGVNLLNATLFEVIEDATKKIFKLINCGESRKIFEDDVTLYSTPVTITTSKGVCASSEGSYEDLKDNIKKKLAHERTN